MNADKNLDYEYSGGIEIPENPPPENPFATFSLMGVQAPVPEPQVYASAADKLNIEFEGYRPGDYLRVFDAKGEVELTALTYLDREVYTLSYDFRTPLLLVTGNSNGTLKTEVDPDGLRRTVMTLGDDYYYIAAEGVYAGGSGDAPLLPGSFVNIKKGEALSADGAVYRIGTSAAAGASDGGGSPDTSAAAGPAPAAGTDLSDGVAMDAEATPLYHFELDGQTIDVFKNYSLTGAGARIPARLLVKDGVMAAIDPSMPAAPDGVILDTEADADDSGGVREIMTVLDDGGMLADLEEPVTLPEGFDTEGIAELTDTLSSDIPIAMVRYKTGRAAAFNYLTGEEIKLAQSRGVSGAGGADGIIDYARKLFGVQRASLLAGISGGYQDLKDYENLIGEGALPDDAYNSPGAGDAGGSGSAGGGEAGEAGDAGGAGPSGSAPSTDDTNGDSGRTGAGNTGDTNGAGGSDNAGTDGDTGSAGDAGGAGPDAREAGDSAPSTGDANGDSGRTGAGNTGDAATPSTGDANGDNAVTGVAANGGDLSRPAPARRLVSMYDFESGAYEVYDESDLLTAAQPEPIATLDYADAVQAEALRELAAQGYKEPVNRGLIVMLIVFGMVAALLVYLYLRKRRLTHPPRKR
jgi:hypothetical protein